MRIIALFNPKGGCGKTTAALNIGYGLRAMGSRVLLIDLDPQAHLTHAMGLSSNSCPTVYHWLKDSAAQVQQQVRGIDLLPAGISLAALDVELQGRPGRELLLKKRLASLQDFDFILVDCPPGLGLLNLNALAGAHELLVPVLAEHLDVYSLGLLRDTVAAVKKHLNASLSWSGFFANRYSRRKLNNQTLTEMKHLFPGLVFKTWIRDNVALSESPAFGQDIFTYQSESIGAYDYLRLCRELLSRKPGSG